MILDALSWLCLMSGALFCIIGAVGLVRMPNIYARIHAAGISETMGVGLILIGLIFQAGLTLVAAKLVLILVFILVAFPAVRHSIAAAAYTHKVEGPEDDVDAKSTGGCDIISD